MKMKAIWRLNALRVDNRQRIIRETYKFFWKNASLLRVLELIGLM